VIITTALTESRLQTDPGSLGGAYGVLQQTPPWWGTKEQVMQVPYATDKFLEVLLATPNWQMGEPWHAAQMVQRSGAGDEDGDGVVDPEDGESNYGPNVGEALAIVAAVGGGEVPADCGGDGGNHGGSGGDFTPSPIAYVGPYDRTELLERANAFVAAGTRDPYFNSITGDWYRMCQHAVANMSGRANSGYATATIAWHTFVAAEVAHPPGGPDGMSPPPGAWLYYDTGEYAGHVAVYLGENQVMSTDTWGKGLFKYGPASDQTDGIWNLTYLGWAAPWGQE
jgi:hypothetical protein